MTRLFGPSGAEGAAPPESPATPAGPGSWKPEPLFGPPATPGAPTPGPASPTPPQAPGEFTRLFQPDKKRGPPAARPPARESRDYLAALNAPTPLPGAPTPSPDVPSGAPRPPVPPAPSPRKEPGEFTRLLSGMPAGGGGSAPPSRGASPGPSDFSRVIGAASPSPSAGRTPSRDEDEAEGGAEEPQRSPRVLLLLVALGVVAAFAIALVLFFALKQSS